MSLVDGGIRLVPISPIVVPGPEPIEPPFDSAGQGIKERAIE